MQKLKPVKLKRTKPKHGPPGEVVEIWENMTVHDLADTMGRSTDSVFDALSYIAGGELYDTKQSSLDDKEIIINVIQKCGFRYKYRPHDVVQKAKVEDALRQAEIDPSRLSPRPPVVTIMGHVDHGKTTLLDTLRNARVVDEEFGGITQHIGAFSVKMTTGDTITFIDTPGHAAFSAMRARGAMATDIIVLVVAADDGVMQQTIESLEHAKAANVPIIIAINKIDKPRANIGTNMTELQEAIITQSELMELGADRDGWVEGVVIESSTNPARGKVATAVIQQGTLKPGAYLVAGTAYGKVRALYSDQNRPIKEAGPSSAVEVVGWKELPSAGDVILQVPTEARMKEVVRLRKGVESEKKADEDLKVIEVKREEHNIAYKESLDVKRKRGFRFRLGRERKPESVEMHTGPYVAVIIKGDVDGSIEALLDTLDTYDSSQCELDIVHFGVGAVTANDVEMADTFNAVIYGFNVSCPASIRKLGDDRNVPIRIHHVIYKLFDDLKTELTSKLPQSLREDVVGEATVQEIYKVTERRKKINVAGCRCTKGTIVKKQLFRVMRDGEVTHEGKLSSLRHFKNEVDSVKFDIECGVCFEEKGVEFLKGDIIQCYSLTPVAQTIDWNLGF